MLENQCPVLKSMWLLDLILAERTKLDEESKILKIKLLFWVFPINQYSMVKALFSFSYTPLISIISLLVYVPIWKWFEYEFPDYYSRVTELPSTKLLKNLAEVSW